MSSGLSTSAALKWDCSSRPVRDRSAKPGARRRRAVRRPRSRARRCGRRPPPCCTGTAGAGPSPRPTSLRGAGGTVEVDVAEVRAARRVAGHQDAAEGGGNVLLDDHAHVACRRGRSRPGGAAARCGATPGRPTPAVRRPGVTGAVDGGDGVVDAGRGEAGQVLGVGRGAHHQAPVLGRRRCEGLADLPGDGLGHGRVPDQLLKSQTERVRTSVASSSSAIFSLPMPCWMRGRGGEEVLLEREGQRDPSGARRRSRPRSRLRGRAVRSAEGRGEAEPGGEVTVEVLARRPGPSVEARSGRPLRLSSTWCSSPRLAALVP